MEILLSKLNKEERQLYDIAHDDGEAKGTMRGFIMGIIIGIVIESIAISFFILK